MAYNSRPKACIPCADSKRRCDKQLPDCQRCLDRGLVCIFPQPYRRQKHPIADENQTDALFALLNPVDTDATGASRSFEGWGALRGTTLGVGFPNTMAVTGSTPPPFVPDTLARRIGLDGDVASDPSCPWFLQHETWSMQHCITDSECVSDIELESFIRAVEGMLRSWTSEGHNCFIHRRLYEKGMPACLQDAFLALAAYSGRTPAIKETILKIADERSFALVCQDAPTASGAPGILSHLARIQALFVYEFIRLFDGSVHFRASAEQQLPTLRAWAVHLWELVRTYQGEDVLRFHRSIQWDLGDSDREYRASSELWKLWILTESVRRTHIIVDTIAKIYQSLTRGWADCAGAVMFTARNGLWEAKSATSWLELSCAQPPLLVPSLQPGPLISQHTAEELDEFAKVFWTFVVGQERIQSWKDKGAVKVSSGSF